jgi:hypothetical protein
LLTFAPLACVANKMIDGHQITICWHTDDLLIGHKNHDVVTCFTRWRQQRYETPDKPLKATRGPIQDYLGMNINFATLGSVSFDMIHYITKVITDFPERITGVASSPAADHLLKNRPPDEARILPESQAIAFHHTIAQLVSSLVSAGTSKQRFLFSPLMLKLRMKIDILTKPLQGVKFCQMRTFLMNCPTDYSKDPPFITPITIESPSIIPMKPQINLITPSPQECVEGLSSSSKPAKDKPDGKDLLIPHRSSKRSKSHGLTNLFTLLVPR